MPKETELKLKTNRNFIEKVIPFLRKSAKGYKVDRTRQILIEDVYLDTESDFLLKQGASLRCRKFWGKLEDDPQNASVNRRIP